MFCFYFFVFMFGVSVLCFYDGVVFLIKWVKVLYKDYWSLFGGCVEFGEILYVVVSCELLEEIGLMVDLSGLVEIFDSI